MSTPTTAVATLPHYHSHRYAHPQGHPPPYTQPHQSQRPRASTNYRLTPGSAASPPSSTTVHPGPSTPSFVPTTSSTPAAAAHPHSASYRKPVSHAGYGSPADGIAQHRSSAPRPLPHTHAHDKGHDHHHRHRHHHQDQNAQYDGYVSDRHARPSLPQKQPQSTDDSTAASMAEQPAKKRRRSRGPDWQQFYRNGLPNEIIVIDDDSPQPEANTRRKVTTSHHAPGAPPTAPNPSGSAYSAPNGTASASAAVASGSVMRHQPAKKRRRDDDINAAASGPGYHVQHVDSQTSTPGGSTVSSDQTHSLNTTAPTSLSSNSNHEDLSLPLKRKRTRQQAANEAKRRDIDVLGTRGFTYKPPPFPPKKASDVNVRAVADPPHHKNVKVDDEDGHYIVVPDAPLTERYQITRLLGQGTFGKVVQAHDRRRGKAVAVKIIRSVQKYRDASRIELRVLATLKANDDENRNRCIHLRDCFDYRGHICIVMDLLGQSVFDFLKGNGFVPFPNSQIQSFARQLFTSVAFLHDLNLIHTDLKPENILLCDHQYQTFTYNRRIPSSSTTINRSATQRRVLLDTEMRLIDFGSATFDDEYHSSVVSTRHYRAPEIILGLGWSYPCDIWSIGCILVEFFTGDALFQTHDNLEHLAMMEAVVGKRIDTHLVQNVNKGSGRNSSNSASKYFKRLRLDYPNAETTRGSRRFVKAMKHLDEVIPPTNSFLRNFRDLLKKIFVYDPSARITAREALNHPWFKEMPYNDDGTEAARIRLERMMRNRNSPYG